jgi:class 3 adenylate cyclase/tetratricopeptide (TPR) repeat protein
MVNDLTPISEQAHSDELLKPYVPRVLIEWLRDGVTTPHRAVDGSLAFVDISGFTELTERLARRGKIGAELLHDTLDGVFTALLDEAYEWGAGLVKWGGDALLLLFDDPEHERRAARAAWEMQRMIERVGRLRVGGTTMVLRMSVGIASGRIDFFVGGSFHRELLIAGPTSTETVQVEAETDAGEIGISPVLAAALDASCVGQRKDRGFLLVGAPDAARARAPDVGSVQGLDVASCIPVASREHVLLERTEPEHRIVAAAFIDLMNTDVLLARLGPAALADELDARISSIQDAAARHDVPFNLTDISNGSIKALLTAGAPSTTGHDEEQVLRTLREVMDRPGVIPMRAGVEVGGVFTGDFGPPYRRAYAVFGDAVNTAARAMSRAEAGQVLSTQQVLDRSRTIFSTTPIEAFRAKGKAEEVRASIVGPIAGRRGERHVETPLVGRDAELATLQAALDELRSGRGSVVEISGAAGIGKSRLVTELVETSPDVQVLRTVCEEYEAFTPYFALRAPMRSVLELAAGSDDIEAEARLREVAARADPELAAWVPLLGILLGLDLPQTQETSQIDARFLRDVLVDVTARFLAAALAGAPLLLVVEDVDFLDEASEDLLRRLSRSEAAPPHVLLLTQLDPAATWVDPAGDIPSLGFTLLPLSVERAAEIVAMATDRQPLRPHDLEEIAERSGGSPLFLFELLDVTRVTGTTDSLPGSVEAVVAAEIDRLSPSDRTVVRYASVLGVRFEQELLAAALRERVEIDEAIWQRLAELIEPDTGSGLRFRNALIREAAYEGLAFRRRRELHARVAETIEAAAASPEDEAPTLARHFFEAQRRDKAWHYCRLAGDHARAVAAHVEAGKFYERALAAAGRLRDVDDHERAAVLVALGAVREAAGLFESSYDALRRATRLLQRDPVEQARVYGLRTRARIRTGSYTNALRETSWGLRLVQGLDSVEAIGARATLRAMRSEILMFQGRPREAIPLAEAAVGDGQRADEFEALRHAYTALDGAYQMLGQPERAVHERMSLDLYTRPGDTRARGILELNLGVQAYAEGKWNEAAEFYDRAEADLLAAGDRPNAAIAKTNHGELLVSRGRLAEAERALGEARRVLRSTRYVPFALFAETQIARIALARGDAEGALESLTGIVEEAEGNAYAASALEGALYFAQAATAAGRAEEGLVVLDDAARRAGSDAVLYSVPVDRVRGCAIAALGRLDEARTSIDRALAGARRQSLLYEQLLALRAQFDLMNATDSRPSSEDLREAAGLAEILGIPG